MQHKNAHDLKHSIKMYHESFKQKSLTLHIVKNVRLTYMHGICIRETEQPFM